MKHSVKWFAGLVAAAVQLSTGIAPAAEQIGYSSTIIDTTMASYNVGSSSNYVFINNWGTLWEFRENSGTWSYTIQRGMCANSWGQTLPLMGSPIAAVYTAYNTTNHVFYFGTDGYLYEYYWALNDSCMQGRNVTADAGQVRPDISASTETFQGTNSYCFGIPQRGMFGGSGLAGLIDSSNSIHVYFAGQGNTGDPLEEVYLTQGASHWVKGTVQGTVLSTSAAAGPGLSAKWDGSVLHVFYTGADGNLWESYYSNGWTVHALTGSAGAVTPTTSLSPQGYIAPMGGFYDDVWGINSTGELQLVSHNTGTWESNTFPVPSGELGWPNQTGGPTGDQFTVSPTGTPTVTPFVTPFYIDSLLNIDSPYVQPNNSLMTTANAPLANVTCDSQQGQWAPLPFTGIYMSNGNNDGATGLFYLAQDGRLHCVYQNSSASSWAQFDVFSAAGVPPRAVMQ
jgi:hypothetical protein